MRIQRLLATALVLSVSLLGLQVASVEAAGAIAGKKCTVIGKTTASAGKTYICAASGKSKIWKLRVIAAKPSPTPSSGQIAMPAQSNEVFATCKLPIADSRGDVSLGLPRYPARGKDIGEVHATVVFVDFPDAKATMTPEVAFSKIDPRATQIFSEMSYGKLNYKFYPNFRWFTMSKPSTAYTYASFQGQHDFAAEAVSLADQTTDFSKSDSVIFLTNPDQKALGNGPAISYNLQSGILADGNNLHNGATSGADLNYWGAIWLNHEISHSFGLVDLYSFTGESYDDYFRYTGSFSYMGYSSESSMAPGLFAWERFALGWLDQSQMFCASNPSGTYAVTPVETTGGVKSVVIPLNATSALVVESRRAIGLDSKLEKPGLLVYRVDTSISSGKGQLQVLSNTPVANDLYLHKAPLAVGESITANGYTIKHVSASDSQDAMTIVRN
jgi:M6 family metalloprotease-like protein